MDDRRSRTSLTAYAPSMRDPDPAGQREAARKLWHLAGIITIFPGDCEKIDREYFEAVATRIYGRRK